MRALQVCPSDHPPFLELCKSHAAALERAGLIVDTVFLGRPVEQRCETATYLGIERGTRRMVRALSNYCAQRRYRLIVTHRYRAHQVVTLAGRVVTDATVIAISHGFGMFARARRRWRQRLLARNVLFAGVSSAVADDLLRDHPQLMHTVVIPNLADPQRLDRARLSRNVARARLDVPASAYVVGVIGRLRAVKRPLLALEGFAGASSLPADARMVFIGNGVLRAPLELLAANRAIEARVHFAGHLVDAAQYLSAFDVLLVASDPVEGFGMTILEGMLAGVPIVCSDVPGPRSVLGPDGIYFSGDAAADLSSALIRCAELPDAAREQLCSAQRARAEREFSVAAVAEIYRRLLSTGGPRPAASS